MATIAVHGGNQVRKKHNERDYETVKDEEHIDLSRPHENWINENYREFYHKIFDEALDKYNAKQKRNDRKIKNYYEKIRDSKNKHVCYECIVGVYDSNIKNDIKHDILKEYVDDFEKRNPNFRIIGAYYHDDEKSKDCHVHLDYVPVAYNQKRGLETQNSLEKALNQMGYFTKKKTLTAQTQWFHKERDYLEKLCNERGIEVQRNFEKRVHLEKDVFIASKQKLQETEKELEKVLDQSQELKETNEINENVKVHFGKFVSKNDYDRVLEENNKLRKIIRKLKETVFRQNELVKRAKDLVELFKKIPAKAQNIELSNDNEQLKQKLNKLTNVEKDYENLKEKYVEQEKRLKTLENERVSVVSKNEYDKLANELKIARKQKSNLEEYTFYHLKRTSFPQSDECCRKTVENAEKLGSQEATNKEYQMMNFQREKERSHSHSRSR